MKKIVLISCVSQKRTQRSKAKDLYISTLFKKNLAYARRLNSDAIYILSAKYGLLDLETEIDPYNLTLNTMSAGQIRTWADKIIQQLSQVANLNDDHFIFLAGMKYRKYLLSHLRSFEIPLEGLTIGKQLQALSGNSINRLKITNHDGKENKMTTKYYPLQQYLTNLPTSQRDVTLTFLQIERIIGDRLPPSASNHRPWWANEEDGQHSHAHAWMRAGWRVDTVDQRQKWVRFVRGK